MFETTVASVEETGMFMKDLFVSNIIVIVFKVTCFRDVQLLQLKKQECL